MISIILIEGFFLIKDILEILVKRWLVGKDIYNIWNFRGWLFRKKGNFFISICEISEI